jgi:hypothetical protein
MVKKEEVSLFIEKLKSKYNINGGLLEFVDSTENSIKLKFFTPSKDIFKINGEEKTMSDLSKEEIEKSIKKNFNAIKKVEFV